MEDMGEASQRHDEPKYKKVLSAMAGRIESLTPGTRLPTVRQLMKEYGVSQAAIERCLDELVLKRMARRVRNRGLFVEGYVPKSRVLGIYTNGHASPSANALFLKGVRAVAEAEGFHAADFGPCDLFTSQRTILATLGDMGFAGIIADLSTSAAMSIEGDGALTDFLRGLRLPLVLTRPLPAIEADSVTADEFAAFRALGERLRALVAGPVRFLGHQGLPSLARLYGLRAGLGEGIEVLSEILDMRRGGVLARVAELRRERWDGSLVIGAPFPEPGELIVLRDAPWRAGSGKELAAILEENQALPGDASAHVLVKPTRRMGEAAAKLLLRRFRPSGSEMRHEIIPYELRALDP